MVGVRGALGRAAAHALSPSFPSSHSPLKHALMQMAADPLAPGPPHAVSLAAYQQVLEPHGVSLQPGHPRSSAKSKRVGEQVVWWTKRS